jgi:hypothetical protein
VESSCELGNETSGSINAGNYRMAAQPVASRAVLRSTELVLILFFNFTIHLKCLDTKTYIVYPWYDD